MTKKPLGILALVGLAVYLYCVGQESKVETFKEFIQKKYPEVDIYKIPSVAEEEYMGWTYQDYDPYDTGEPY